MASSAAIWRNELSKTMRDLGFSSCLADPDVWMRAATKSDGYKYWEYILVHSDDLLVISHRAKLVMKGFDTAYTLKPDAKGKKWAEPTMYLGADIAKFQVPDTGEWCWSMSGDTYLKEAVKNVEIELAKSGRQLYKNTKSAIKPGYRPELDVSPVLDDKPANYYQTIVGQLRWAVELGRIDINLEISLFSRYLAQPRQGHLDQLFHTFSFLKSHSKSKVVLDPFKNDFDGEFVEYDWQDFYGEVQEDFPENAPEARGESVTMTQFVDDDHAGDMMNR